VVVVFLAVGVGWCLPGGLGVDAGLLVSAFGAGAGGLVFGAGASSPLGLGVRWGS